LRGIPSTVAPSDGALRVPPQEKGRSFAARAIAPRVWIWRRLSIPNFIEADEEESAPKAPPNSRSMTKVELAEELNVSLATLKATR
jgi:hypothetical protein